jgi:uncharacterized membrane protein (DUF106 family)
MGVALAVILGCELIMYALVYRGEDYRDMKGQIDREQRKVEKEKAKHGPEKQISKIEGRLNQMNAELMRVKLKGFLLTAVVSLGTIKLMGSFYNETLVAVLPFEPFSFIKNLTHSGLTDPKPRDCGYLFIYILSSVIFRSVVQHLLDFEGLALKKKQ